MSNFFRSGKSPSLWLCAILFASLVSSGCGSGSGSGVQTGVPSVDATHGSLQFRVVFPVVKRGAGKSRTRSGGPPTRQPDGSIPSGSHSVQIVLTNPTTGAQLAPVRVVSDQVRPDGVTGFIIVGYPLLPVGPVEVDVEAYASLDASGNPLATGTNTTTIVANTIVSTNVLMTLTFDHLVVSPQTQNLSTSGSSGPFSVIVDAQAVDAQGNVLLYPLQYSSDQPQVADVTSVAPDFMHATITAQTFVRQPVQVNITVTEPNSGATGTSIVVVGP